MRYSHIGVDQEHLNFVKLKALYLRLQNGADIIAVEVVGTEALGIEAAGAEVVLEGPKGPYGVEI